MRNRKWAGDKEREEKKEIKSEHIIETEQ